MDFAKRQLEKYGWKEGQGLGKNETGLSTAIKPKLKFDNAGLGHNPSDEFKNNRWDNIYNQAACNINVSVDSENVQFKLNSEELTDISTKGLIKGLKHQNEHLEYGSFIKKSTLTEKGIFNEVNDAGDVSLSKAFHANILSDEELFAACEGRTAHKGARHGLRQSGKLSRLEKQEKMLLKKLKKVSITDDSNGNKKNLEKKLKKLNDQKVKNRSEALSIGSTEHTFTEKNFLLNSPKLNKSRKKQRKRVSFNETVTEYQTQELDSSSHSAESGNSPCASSTVTFAVRLQDEKEDNAQVENNNEDEGIDCPDLDPKNSDSNSNSDEFDTPVYKELSKKERKILRRKLKKQNERNSKTSKFIEGILEKMCDVEVEVEQVDEKCQKCSKRKLKFDPDDTDESDVKKSHYERLNKKKMKNLKKKQKKLEKRLNKVVNSFSNCKISDSE